eukprot:COSAG01_NODE_9381_length_2462_cov_1.555226_3_plen_123_part_00
MIYPFRKLPIRGVIWYQGESVHPHPHPPPLPRRHVPGARLRCLAACERAGEANAGRAANYACQMRAMIEGWRSAWRTAAAGPEEASQAAAALANFTFIEHQLSACTYHLRVVISMATGIIMI